jgi:molybdate/tungstate transport system permease protein
MRKQSLFYWTISLLGALLLLFLIAPLIKLLFGSALVSWNPLYNDAEVWDSIFRTLTFSFVATFTFSFGAIPLAYLLAKKNFRFKRLIISLIDIPLLFHIRRQELLC